MSNLLHVIVAAATTLPSNPPSPGGSTSVPPLINPPTNPNAPGGAAFSQLIGAVKFYALAFSVMGVLISGCVFGLGRYMANQYAAVGGRIGLFACLGTAVVVGGGSQLVQWAFNLGNSIHP